MWHHHFWLICHDTKLHFAALLSLIIPYKIYTDISEKLAVHSFSSTSRGKVNVKIMNLETRSIHTYNIHSASKAGLLSCRCCRSFTNSHQINEKCPARLNVKIDRKFIIGRQTATKMRFEVSDSVHDQSLFNIERDCTIPPNQSPLHTCQYFKVLKAIKPSSK